MAFHASNLDNIFSWSMNMASAPPFSFLFSPYKQGYCAISYFEQILTPSCLIFHLGLLGYVVALLRKTQTDNMRFWVGNIVDTTYNDKRYCLYVSTWQILYIEYWIRVGATTPDGVPPDTIIRRWQLFKHKKYLVGVYNSNIVKIYM